MSECASGLVGDTASVGEALGGSARNIFLKKKIAETRALHEEILDCLSDEVDGGVGAAGADAQEGNLTGLFDDINARLNQYLSHRRLAAGTVRITNLKKSFSRFNILYIQETANEGQTGAAESAEGAHDKAPQESPLTADNSPKRQVKEEEDAAAAGSADVDSAATDTEAEVAAEELLLSTIPEEQSDFSDSTESGPLHRRSDPTLAGSLQHFTTELEPVAEEKPTTAGRNGK